MTVVDARHIERQLGDARADGGVNEAQQQVAFADVVLLNKVRGVGGWEGGRVCWLAVCMCDVLLPGLHSVQLAA